MPPYKPLADRLIGKVRFEAATHCMIFTGPLDACGYGKMNGGKDLPRETLAHRAAYFIWCEPLKKGFEIDHRCGNRACINPQHLWQILHSENVRYSDHKINHRNRVKTHCKNGHEFTPENTAKEIWLGKPRRKCRTCRNLLQNLRKRRSICIG